MPTASAVVKLKAVVQMKALPRFELAASIASFALIFVCGLLRQLALRSGAPQSTVDLMTRLAVLLLFFVFAFSLLGLAFHAFVALQIRTGNGADPIVRFLSSHETGLTFAFWGFLGVGNVDRSSVRTDRFGWSTDTDREFPG